jgi:16S rRNA (cytosine1402-N4)-methyltransferase
MSHIPVLLKEVLEYADVGQAKKVIDGTAGDGGYIREILKANSKVNVLGIDLDQTSLDKLGQRLALEGLSQNVSLVHGNYKDIKHIASEKSFLPADTIILDLGFSSSQLDDEMRGLSFQAAGPLDMRFDSSRGKTAADVVNTYHPKELAQVFREYGEEKLAGKIASEIIRIRRTKKFESTKELYDAIRESLPKPVVYKVNDFARRVFQALRIEVNQELENLKTALPDMLEILAPGGRMLVISFHSLEDRIVKEFFANRARGCVCPPDFPTCVCGKNPRLKILTKKPVTTKDDEIETNSRSKPAKLRVAQKIT